MPVLQAREQFAVRSESSNRLAVLIAAPHSANEAGIYNDFEAMKEVLLRTGFSKDTIVSVMLENGNKQEQLMTVLSDVRKKVSSWSCGQLFLYYTGHGTFDYKTGAPGLALGARETVYWNEVFSALNAPRGLNLIVLPDC